MDVAGMALAFGVLLLIFLPLERAFPAHRQSIFRQEWGTDLLFFAGQYLLWTVPVVSILGFLYMNANALPLGWAREFVAKQPLWIQIPAILLISDLCVYWFHRWSHRNPVLWRIHRVHHTAEALDWLAAHREHPIDNLLTRFVENLPLILLGVPLGAIAGFAIFRGLWAIYIHSNVNLSPGPLRYLMGSSRIHHWHHEVHRGSHVNYANLSPLMDLLFGTFHDPGFMPSRYGTSAKVSHRYIDQMLEPIGIHAARSIRRGIRIRRPKGSRGIKERRL